MPVTSSTQHGHMSGAMPSKPFTRGPGSTWLRSEFSTAVRRTAASQAFDLPQAPHAYAILVDARVQTAGCVASRLHAVADLEVLGKAQLHRRSQLRNTHRRGRSESSCKFASSKECTGDGARDVPPRAWCLGRLSFAPGATADVKNGATSCAKGRHARAWKKVARRQNSTRIRRCADGLHASSSQPTDAHGTETSTS